jgi:hypothetical protein
MLTFRSCFAPISPVSCAEPHYDDVVKMLKFIEQALSAPEKDERNDTIYKIMASPSKCNEFLVMARSVLQQELRLANNKRLRVNHNMKLVNRITETITRLVTGSVSFIIF